MPAHQMALWERHAAALRVLEDVRIQSVALAVEECQAAARYSERRRTLVEREREALRELRDVLEAATAYRGG